MKKLLVALIASAFAVTAFAQAPKKADPATPAKVEKETDKKGAKKAPKKVKSTAKAADKKDTAKESTKAAK